MTCRVVVVGGGVAGLATAYELRQHAPGVEVQLFEKQHRLGGLVHTERVDGYVIEHGPDSLLRDKPEALALAEKLGLSPIGTRDHPRGAFVVRHGELHKIPPGFTLVAPAQLGPFLRTPLLSCRGKLRTLFDLVLPRGPAGEDESLASFVQRRFGKETLDRIVQPLAAGIYGTRPELLSLESTLPRFRQMEQEHRSVIRALRKNAKATDRAGVRYSAFASFEGGVGELTERLVQQVQSVAHTGCAVKAIDRAADAWVVHLQNQRTIRADRLVLAVPAPIASSLLATAVPDLARALARIPYGSAAAVTFAWPRAAVEHPLDGFGFVVPYVEGRPVVACTWSSVKWPHRAPPDKVLFRVFIGGPLGERLVDKEDEELVDTAIGELRRLMFLRGAPLLSRVTRYRAAMPRYHVGHARVMAEIERSVQQQSNLWLAGNAYRGVGVSDAIRSGQSAARQVLKSVQQSA